MPVISDSYNRAYDACDDVLIEEGRFPTVEAIRNRIDTNSPAIIKRAINDWLLNFAKKHKERLRRPDLPDALLEAVDNIWKTATDQSKKVFDVDVKEFQLREETLEGHLQLHKETNEKLTQEWQDKEAAYVQQLELSNDRIKSLEQQLETKDTVLLVHGKQLIDTQQTLTITEATLQELRRAQEVQATEWKVRFEQEHTWHLKRIEEEKEALRLANKTQIERLSNKLQAESLEREIQSTKINQVMGKLDNLLETLSTKDIEIATLRTTLELQARVIKQKSLPTRAGKPINRIKKRN